MKKVAIILILLIVIVGVFAFLNREGLKDKKLSQENAIITIVADGTEYEVSFTEIQELEEVEFPAVLRSSGKPPVDTSYTGVELKDILEKRELKPQAKPRLLPKPLTDTSGAFHGRSIGKRQCLCCLQAGRQRLGDKRGRRFRPLPDCHQAR